ncbi:H+/Cl-antiporter ClcA [Isobaculum melis]|uniref:H+/Cl-antiporter ClcA n=1 Tax=Isobaculum melis TaxID=142588 RepID=A0A1H9SBT2_9LACT|nr:H+/Cl-antiporter ClcA [Isobaculum melis]
MIYGILLSSIVAGISVLFLFLERIFSEFIWEELPAYLNWGNLYLLLICLIGGLLVGFGHKKWGALPRSAHDAMSELKQTKTLDYHVVLRSLVMALLILSFGAGVGPEAALLGSVIALSVWQADKMRYYYFHYQELKQVSILARVKRLSHPIQYLLTYDEERAFLAGGQKKKKVLYGVFIINGLVTFTILMKMSGQPSFVSKMGTSNWGFNELLLIFPFIGFGVLYGLGYHLLKKGMKKIFSFGKHRPIQMALIGSAAIFLIAVYLPNLLFSGQLSLSLVPYVGMKESVILLSIVALIKLIYLQVCLNTGWTGGDIFPVVFASIIQGFAMAQLFPQYDTLLIVAIVSTSMSIVILKSPIVVGIFIALFFPLNLLPIILFITCLFLVYQKVKTAK